MNDDFSTGVDSWLSSPGWSLVEQAPGQFVYRGNSMGDTFTRSGYLNLGSSWRIEVDVRFQRHYADNNRRGLVAFALFPALDSGVQLLADIDQRTNEAVKLDVAWFNTTNQAWNGVSLKDWSSSRGPAYRMHLIRAAGSDRLIFKVTSTNGFSYRAETAKMPLAFLDRMKVFGFRVNSGQADFSNLRAVTPYSLPPPPAITAHPEAQTVMAGSTVTFSVAATGPGPLTYQWLRGTATLTAETNNTLTIRNVQPIRAGSYSVVVSNGESTATSQPAVLNVIGGYFRPTAATRTNDVTVTGFGVEFVVPNGADFRLQRSHDLNAWADLTNSIGTGSPMEFIDAEATNHTFRVYRILYP